MNRTGAVVFLCGFLFLSVIASAQAVGDYQTRGTGLWSGNTTWRRFVGPPINNWQNTSIAPTSANGAINIRAGHTVTISSVDVIADQLVVDPFGAVIINSGRTLTIANGAGVDLTVSGLMTINGRLEVSSGAAVDTNNSIRITSSSSGDGQLGIMQGTINGGFTVERYVANLGVRAYRYIASPVTNKDIAAWQVSFPITGPFTNSSTSADFPSLPPITSSTPSLFYYNQATDSYINYPTTDNTAPVDNGVGYAAFFRDTDPITISVSGTVRTGDVPINLTANGAGWNLIGNPYPSAISWDLVDLTTVPPGQISDTYSVLDNTDQSGVGAGSFAYYQQGGAIAIPPGFDGTIAMGQAFWVQATAATTLTFQESNKLLPLTAPLFFRKASADPRNIIRIKAEGLSNGLADETIVCFNEEATDGKDRKDASKRVNAKLNLSSFSSDGQEMAINTFSNLPIDRIVKLKLSNATTGGYRLNFSQLESFLALPTIQLEDDFAKQTVSIDAQNSIYNFSVTSDPLSYGDKRFRINIKNLVTSVEDEEVTINGYPNPISNQFTVSLPKNVSFSGSIEFYNSIGQRVEPLLVNSTSTEKSFDFSNFQFGMFIVKIPTPRGVHLLKAIKK
jgi:hypothetical protein